ncbi:MAG: DoxX family protein [Bacteroidota bacterium]
MKQKIIFVVCLLFGLMFINAGLDKFFHYMPQPENMPESMMKAFAAFTAITWLMPLVGAVEVIGGILFIIPKTRALGAIVVFPVIVGIFLTNTVTDTMGLPIALVFLAINVWILIENRKKYAPMINE